MMRSTLGFPAYFDGDSTRELIEFQWAGDPHNSRSLAIARLSDTWLRVVRGATSTTGIAPAVPASETVQFPGGRRLVAYARNTDAASPWEIGLGPYGISQDNVFSNLDLLNANAAVVEPSVEYSASIRATVGKASLSQVGSLHAFIVWRDESGDFISQDDGPSETVSWGGGDPLGAYNNRIRTVKITATSPAGAAFASVGVMWVDGMSEVSADTTLLADQAIMVIGPSVPDYFDGSTTNSDNFTYTWEGDPDRATSLRVGEEPSLAPGPIVDPDCPPPPPAPTPPSPRIGCDEQVSEWRRVWYVVPAEEVYTWGSVLTTFTISSGDDAIDALRITVWENPDNDDPADFDDSASPVGRWNISYLPANSTMVLDGATQRITATQEGGTSQDAGYLVSGATGGPVLWPSLACGEQYLIAIDTPLGDDPDNVTLTLDLTRSFG